MRKNCARRAERDKKINYMSPLLTNNPLHSNLSSKHRRAILELDEKLQSDHAFLGHLCQWIKNKLGDKITSQLDQLSDEGKYETCVEHIIIALAAGDITVADIKKILQQK